MTAQLQLDLEDVIVDDNVVTPLHGSNRPPVQQQIDRLGRDVEALREAMGHVMAAIVPAFQTLQHLEDAAKALLRAEEANDG